MPLGTEVNLRANWTWGSRMKVKFDWGDGMNDVEIYSDNSRESEFSHLYAKPGTYFPSVSIWNYLIDCSNQSLQLHSDNMLVPIEIFNPPSTLSDFTLTPNFTGWRRNVPFNLSVFIGNATFINLTINWNDSASDSLYVEFIADKMKTVY